MKANVIKSLIQFPMRTQKFRKALIKNQNEQNQQSTSLNALSMVVAAHVSRKRYEIIRIFKCSIN